MFLQAMFCCACDLKLSVDGIFDERVFVAVVVDPFHGGEGLFAVIRLIGEEKVLSIMFSVWKMHPQKH